MPPALSTGALFGRSPVRSLSLLAKRLHNSERPINISCCSSETNSALVSHKIFSGGAIGRSSSSPFRMQHSVSSTLKWPRQSRCGVSNVPWYDAQRWQSGGVRCMSAGSPEHVVVEEDQESTRYRHTISSGRHVLKGDLAPEAGGTDAGPSPKELVMSSLGLCTSMTIRMYADRKKWPLERVRVEVREFTKPDAHVPEELLVTVHLTGPLLDEKQRARLHQIGDRCPVKRMLKGEMSRGISSVLATQSFDHVIE